jgi:hypothetical protein
MLPLALQHKRRGSCKETGNMEETSKALWHKIIPYPIGTRVRTVSQEAITPIGFNAQNPPLDSEGVIERYVEKSWKIHMIDVGCYPSEILTETMYVVTFDIHTGRKYPLTFAIRGQEIEAI